MGSRLKVRVLSLQGCNLRFLVTSIRSVTNSSVCKKERKQKKDTLTNSSTSASFCSAFSNLSFNSAASTLASRRSSNCSSVLRHRLDPSSSSFSSRLFSFSSSSIRTDCFRYTSCTESPSADSGGSDGDLIVADGDGDTLPCDTDVLRNDDDLIFDWIESEGWRPCDARGASSFVALCASLSGPGDVGASGMGSAGDSARSGTASGCA